MEEKEVDGVAPQRHYGACASAFGVSSQPHTHRIAGTLEGAQKKSLPDIEHVRAVDLHATRAELSCSEEKLRGWTRARPNNAGQH